MSPVSAAQASVSASRQRFIVMATGGLTVETVNELLRAAGFAVDADFPAVVVDERDGRFVLRAYASRESLAALGQVPGLELFPDLEVQRAS